MNEPNAPHILVVDDDPAIRELIAAYLGENGMRVSEAASGKAMSAALAEQAIDLVILDLRLPGEDGIEIARRIRVQSALPIIVVSGLREEADRVMALELGADDYLTKPFSSRELLARVRALLRRANAASAVLASASASMSAAGAGRQTDARAYRFAGWELNLGTRKLTSPRGEAVPLTNGEFSLLQAFLAAPGCVLAREQLLEASRLYADVYDRSIDVQILRLRRKIEAVPARPEFIKTERGAGYVFAAPVEKLTHATGWSGEL
ncbi:MULTISPECIES: response regulator transcription factor [Paraburkholderia]|uniref:DNA-binding response regulator, OmpR family, contains REC and winged-helix (WHTH) domain n=1 Tax=Paraburkholderia tropica TaxID=92647 RepID=A0A1A5XEP8_9BURK|nr:response regulator transcription factor [Paraburkholderia tropica]MBB2982441.1 DNA-binding response OmpR family regulator [Paraburkholderia tropica]MBB3001595.1 DNA-binding response OmpR family regulator [Paraburkholderia tropica]MBB6321209.1 DNA-binding response OmpR family regulator [Paraburkholderia tropica]OBR51956.1 DNA-binding response regulator [Paraburkholderia tropica]QNB14734.1 response regulator transcription factor [Paraburkholderia tropica]